jgi:hypothetical protein|tara:strand:+ start:259 stop:447 length:189 start_codon:yes stop_codon:yes gene_type:complete
MFTHALVNGRGIIVKKFHSLTEATNAALTPPLCSSSSSYGYRVYRIEFGSKVYNLNVGDCIY